MVLMSLGGMLQFKDSEYLKEISQLAGFHTWLQFSWLVLKSLGALLQFKDSGDLKIKLVVLLVLKSPSKSCLSATKPDHH